MTTRHHWDHPGGLRAYIHEGATVITHDGNKPYFKEVLRAGPWTLEPDRHQRALLESEAGDKQVLYSQ